MRENSHSDSAEEELPYSNKFKRKLSNNGKSTQDKVFYYFNIIYHILINNFFREE